jgi:hypothetical protein
MVDARTDVFALGAVLYRLLSGRPPYDGASTAQALDRAARGDHPDLDILVPEAPAPLREICKKAMAIQADKRFVTAQHLADALETFASSAVSKAYEQTAGRSTVAALLFGICATAFGIFGLARAALSELLRVHLFFGLTFFIISMGLAWLEWRARGRLGLAPLGYGMAASTMMTGFIAVGFSIINHTGDWEAAARVGAAGLALNSLLSALALGFWGLVMFRRAR